MTAASQGTLGMLGFPPFTLVVGIAILVALAGLGFGIARWKRPAGKIAVVASASLLLILAMALVLVLVTVASGSMG